MNAKVSVIIPTLNPGAGLGKLFATLQRQDYKGQVEIIVIDSESTDGSADIGKQKADKWFQVKRKNFSHSATRNLAAEIATGEFLVFLCQDMLPANDEWLSRLLQPLLLIPHAAGVYSRQLPYADAPPWELWDISSGAPARAEVKCLLPGDELKPELLLSKIKFSNVASCLRKEVWREIPFDERLPSMEDQAWAYSVLKKGYCLIYAADSMVWHSHNLSLRQYAARHLDFGKAKRIFLPGQKNRRGILPDLIIRPWADSVYFLSRKGITSYNFYWSFYSFVVRLVMKAAEIIGRKGLRFPQWMYL